MSRMSEIHIELTESLDTLNEQAARLTRIVDGQEDFSSRNVQEIADEVQQLGQNIQEVADQLHPNSTVAREAAAAFPLFADAIFKADNELHGGPDLQPILAVGGGVLGTVTDEGLVIPDTPVPPTDYGVRILFADETGDDYDNIDGIQVFHKTSGTFPFGFVRNEEGEHVAGFWTEEGAFEPFDARQTPRPGW